MLLNDGNGGFTLAATVQVDSDGLGHILPGDFNGDGRMDIVTGGPNSELGIVYGIP